MGRRQEADSLGRRWSDGRRLRPTERKAASWISLSVRSRACWGYHHQAWRFVFVAGHLRGLHCTLLKTTEEERFHGAYFLPTAATTAGHPPPARRNTCLNIHCAQDTGCSELVTSLPDLSPFVSSRPLCSSARTFEDLSLRRAKRISNDVLEG